MRQDYPNNEARHYYRAGAARPGANRAGTRPAATPPATPRPAGTRGFFSPPGGKRNIIIVALALLLVLCVVLVLLLPSCTAAWGGAPGSSSVSAPQASAPLIDPDYNKNANSIPQGQYEGTILGVGEELSAAALEEYMDETLFLGDSNTERMSAFRDVTGLSRQNAIGVEGMSVSGFTANACVRFNGYQSPVTMPEAVKLLHPRRVVITFGTNDAVGVSVDNFIKSYRAALDAIAAAYPYSDVIIGAVFPIEHNRSYTSLSMTTVDKYNLALVELAKETGNRFLNWSEALRDPATGYCKKGYMLDDGIHLNKAGMQAAFDYFRGHLLQNAEADPRPLPLDTRPTVQGAVQPQRPAASSSSSSSSASPAAQGITVTFLAGEGGLIEIGGAQKASFAYTLQPGDTVPAARAVPNPAATEYAFKGWTAAGVTLSGADKADLASFVIPEGTKIGSVITLTAVFQKPTTATVTFVAGANGSISPSGAVQIAPGASSGVYTVTPAAGYTFPGPVGWSCSAGGMAQSGGGWVFTLPAAHNPAEPVTVTANFIAAPQQSFKVPSLADKNVSIIANGTYDGWPVSVTYAESADVPEGTIISQNPVAGTDQPAKTTITVVVAKAPAVATLPVPDFVGRPYANTIDVWTLTPTYVADAAPAGQIIGQGVTVGEQRNPAAGPIPVTVSSGPAPAAAAQTSGPVPNFVGQTFVSTIDRWHLTPVYDSSSDWPHDIIFGQRSAAGTIHSFSDSIFVDVSGPKP